MRRMFRAAGIAAAAALYAVTAFAAPAMAQDSPARASVAYQHQSESLSDSGLAVNDSPAQTNPASANSFSQLFGHAVAAIAEVQAAPTPAAAAGQRSLDDLVATYVTPAALDAQQDCLASAVYFEARGETLEGQLAVAQVVLNRAASGRFPPDVCQVVTQKAQFSFVRRGRIPEANRNCGAWHNAVAIAEIARERLVSTVPSSVLWYHASYVSPGWGQRLVKTARIGLHIFYS
jgi:spore germination cell wall hydrolase CwlJ-like protein